MGLMFMGHCPACCIHCLDGEHICGRSAMNLNRSETKYKGEPMGILGSKARSWPPDDIGDARRRQGEQPAVYVHTMPYIDFYECVECEDHELGDLAELKRHFAETGHHVRHIKQFGEWITRGEQYEPRED